MGMTSIPDEITQEIENALNNINSPLKLGGSTLLSSFLVTKRLQENPSELSYQALKAVLTGILDILKAENPSYADILHGRFWEDLSPNNMIAQGRPKQWSEKTFYNYQKKARREFYSLFWQREQNLRQDAQSSVDFEPISPEEINRTSGEKPSFIKRTMFSSLWAYLFLVLFSFSIVALYIIVSNNKNEPAEPTVAVTVAPITATPVSFSFPPTETHQSTLCGEKEQIAVDLSIQRLIRSQGVSNFNVGNIPGLISNTVRALAIDSKGRLWIGYFGDDTDSANGVALYDKVALSNCDFSEFVEPQNINVIEVSHSGKIWIGTEKNGLLSFDGKEWNHFTKDDGLPSDEIFDLTIDEQDNLWVGTWEGVAKFDGANWSLPYQVQNDTVYNNHISSIVFDSENNIWIGHISDGVSKYRQSDGTWIYYTSLNETGLAGDKIRSILVRHQNVEQPESVWFATADGGISRLEQGKWTIYRVEDGLPSNDVSDLAVDRYNRVWAATSKGVAFFNDKAWTIYHTLSASTIAIGKPCLVEGPCPFDDDHVWTGTPGNGLTHSRIPLPDTIIKVVSICFVTLERERVCPPFSFDNSLPIPTITAEYPVPLKPNESIRFEITVSPEGTYDLREDRGDFLSNTDDNDFDLFGAWPVIGVKGIVEPGQPYIFTDYDNPFVAPELSNGIQQQSFVSTWRLWRHTRYVGPLIHLVFIVDPK